MIRIINLPPGMQIVRISKLHRGKRAEYPKIGQAAVKRVMRDMDIATAAKARKALEGLVSNPTTRLENDRAIWMVQGAPLSTSYIKIDPADLVTLDPQVLKLLAGAATDTLHLEFIQAFSDQPVTAVSKQFLKALRVIIMYNRTDAIRKTYSDEINQLLKMED